MEEQLQIIEEPQAKPLFKKLYEKEDFSTTEPYDELYENRNNPFLQGIMIEKLRQRAKEVGYTGFMDQWKRYQRSKRTDLQADDIGQDTMFDGQPVQLRCGNYTCTDNVTRFNEYGMEVEVISHPLMPVRRVTNIETLEAKLEIAFRRGKKDPWKKLTVPRKQLASAQQIINLADMDIDVNSENAKEVVKYMSALESKNYDELPRHNAVSHMGWLPDGRFMPYVDDIIYDGGEGPEFDKIYRELTPTGDESAWMDVALKTRAGESVPARIALAAGFAAPLVKMLDALSFVVHIWGAKGCGKSVGLMLAASIWGNPDIGGLAKTFNGTKVSFETMSAFCCNIPVMIDELQIANDNRRNFDELIYMLCEGASRSRGLKTGGLQLQKRWLTSIITTGETPIIQSNSGGGAAVRTIEVNFKNTPLFGDDMTARKYAGILKKNYGFAGKRFVEALYDPKVISALQALQTKFYNELTGDIDGKQVLSASILLAADALATKLIFKDKRSLKVDELKEFLITKEESDVDRRCYEYLLDWIAASPRRFDSADSNNGEFWGVIEDDIAYINRSIFDNALKNGGYSSRSFLNWAKQHDLLVCEDHGEGNERRLTIRKVLPSGRFRCIALRIDDPVVAKKLSEREAYVLAAEELPEDMPF